MGYAAMGVPVGGAADPVWMACANALLGNEPDAAVIEVPLAGPTLRAADEPVRVAIVGDVDARLLGADGRTQLIQSWRTVTLRAGETLRVAAVRSGVAYVALSGGCLVPPQLGSRATYARAGLGGIDGRALKAGDVIACGAPRGDPNVDWQAGAFAHEAGPIRVMPGPQEDAFEPASLKAFYDEAFVISRDSDRMGMRLTGPVLRHLHSADLCSEGVVPGAIQVPANGAPIILMSEAQTVGGYTKIATVIRADLPRLAQLSPGAEIRFTAVTRAQALAARQQQKAALSAWVATIESLRPEGGVDLELLYESNLLSGIIDARRDTLPWE